MASEALRAVLFAAGLAALAGLPARRAAARAAAGALAALAAGVLAYGLGAEPAAAAAAAALGAAGAAGGALRAGSGRHAAGDLVGGVGAFSAAAVRVARPPRGGARAERVLDAADGVALERAVLEAESETRAELAVVVVDAAAPHAGARARFAAWLAALALLGAPFAWPAAPVPALLAAQAAAAGLGYAAARAPALRRALVGERALAAAAETRARRAFAETGLARTPERAGVLVFVALLEARAIVLAGEGAHHALGGDAASAWSALAEHAAEGVRAARPAEGIAAGLAKLRPLLETRLPGPARAPGALPRALRVEP